MRALVEKVRASNREPDRVAASEAGPPRPVAAAVPKPAPKPAQKPAPKPAPLKGPRDLAGRSPGKYLPNIRCRGCNQLGHKVAKCPNVLPYERKAPNTVALPNPAPMPWSEPYYPMPQYFAPQVPCITISFQLPGVGMIPSAPMVLGMSSGW